ncbi:cytochrome P450 monooxygenase pc-3 [Panaeolus papilionaceus]|nr:cytochrome P450 monooxygenase pc-3 [Panaeolus papilionaceus]
MAIPPGPLYLLRSSPGLVVPPLAAYGLLRVIEQHLTAPLPAWLSFIAVVSAIPGLFVFQRYYKRFRDYNAASANNAFLVPAVQEEGPSIFGTSLVRAIMNNLNAGYIGDVFLDWMEKYGPIYQLRLPLENRVVTFDPDHIKAITATQFDAFEKGSMLHNMMHSFLGTGVFNSDGDMWKFHRTMTRPFFTRERISHFDIFDAHADDALKQAASRLAEGHPIDFQDLVSRFTLDSATLFLFGSDVESLSAGLPYPHNKNSLQFLNHPANVFAEAFLAGQVQLAQRTRFGPNWPLLEFWGDKIKPLREVMDKFTEPLMAEALEKKRLRNDEKTKSQAEPEDDTLLTHLVNHTEDPTILKDELLNLLVAGRDTTACTLTFAFYMLAEHPKIAEKLRQEILDKVGPSRRPTYEDIRDMRYLRAFLNEVLRLYPAVPFDSRSSTKATILTSKAPGSKPYYIPAHTRVIYGLFNMQRRADLWGPDALEFDPDRFLDHRLHKYLLPNPYIFSPFNAGPRICLGQQFAYQESSFFLIRLLQQFTNFSLAPDAQPEETKPPLDWSKCGGRKAIEKVRPGSHLTMYSRGGLWVRMDEIKT